MMHPIPARAASPILPFPPALGPNLLRLSPLGAPERAPDVLSAEEIAARLDGSRVLLVEDEVIVALELSMELEDRGAEVVGPAHSLPEAQVLAEEGGIDAAILDVDLQGKDVYPVAERLMRAGVPFVFHTGHGDRSELRRRFDGAVVCTKPTLSEELVETLASIMR